MILAITTGQAELALYILGICTALTVTWLFYWRLRGRYDAEFVLDRKGVLCRTQAKQAKKNRIVNALTVILGLLSGKPAWPERACWRSRGRRFLSAGAASEK